MPLEPALWRAASSGQAEEVKRLVADGAEIEESGGPFKTTPLNEASWQGHWEVVMFLLDKADLSAADSEGFTPLQAIRCKSRPNGAGAADERSQTNTASTPETLAPLHPQLQVAVDGAGSSAKVAARSRRSIRENALQ
jgi:hypothetical protein